MTDTIYDRIHRSLTWKRIIAFNFVLFLVLIVPLSVQLAQTNTENRSSASSGNPVPSVTPPPSYPSSAPSIARVSMFFGKPGDTVVVLGSNFGDYQWGSHVYVGNVEATADNIVRWSNTVLEVKIPEGARTGKVWVVVNGKQAAWDGSLLLYDVAHAAQVGFQRLSSTQAHLFTLNASGAVRGMLDIAYDSEPVTFTPGAGVTVTSQSPSVDNLGKTLTIAFTLASPLSSAQTVIGDVSYPGIGSLEIIRAELYDASNTLMPLYSDPLSVKLLPQ